MKGTFESATFDPDSIDLEHLYLNYKCAYCGWTILQVDPIDGPFYSRVVFDRKGREEVQDFCSESCWQEKRMKDK